MDNEDNSRAISRSIGELDATREAWHEMLNNPGLTVKEKAEILGQITAIGGKVIDYQFKLERDRITHEDEIRKHEMNNEFILKKTSMDHEFESQQQEREFTSYERKDRQATVKVALGIAAVIIIAIPALLHGFKHGDDRLEHRAWERQTKEEETQWDREQTALADQSTTIRDLREALRNANETVEYLSRKAMPVVVATEAVPAPVEPAQDKIEAFREWKAKQDAEYWKLEKAPAPAPVYQPVTPPVTSKLDAQTYRRRVSEFGVYGRD
ncbi:MAG: hypothetical protein M2R46_05326 [Verrucomicrobia subdivision 3 bacterium]|nr:hypothetical protein [Limisphaerales bacterium]